MIYSDGWQKSYRDYGCLFHVQLKSNGKVHLRHDGTNLELGREMVEKGIAKEDLILDFHSPAIRRLAGFTVA